MKRLIILTAALNLIMCHISFCQSVGIGTNAPNSSAVLDVSSTSKGMLVPRMTTAQRTAIASPAAGLLVYDNTTGSFWFKNSGSWTELVDTSNNNWKQNGESSFTGTATRVGIRTSAPGKPLDVRTHDSIAGQGIRIHNSSLVQGSKASLLLSSNSLPQLNSGYAAISAVQGGGFQSQHLIFSTAEALGSPSTERMRIDSAGNINIGGNVAIGLSTADVKLHVSNGSDVGNASGGFIQLGPTTASNIAIDNNEIMARTNGLAAKLIVQANGGEFQTGAGASQFNFTTSGELTKPQVTGAANLLPLSYGKVLFDGSTLGGTNNFTVTKAAVGNYTISLPNETNLYANQDNYTILVTPYKKQNYAGESFAANVLTTINSNNTITVYVREFDVNYQNMSCDCYGETRTFTYISSMPTYVATDASFSFIIYKM